MPDQLSVEKKVQIIMGLLRIRRAKRSRHTAQYHNHSCIRLATPHYLAEDWAAHFMRIT